MRGSKAKKIRKQVYGDMSLRSRLYYRDSRYGHVITDECRRNYQKAKGRRECPTKFEMGDLR